MSRVVVLAGTYRLPAGVLPGQVWALLRTAVVCTGSPDHPQLEALRMAGTPVSVVENKDLSAQLAALDDDATLGWLAGAEDGGPAGVPAGSA
ncbi:MAG: hypothetical protein ACYCO3_14180, partial [Mycobacteriales bacterium]